MGNESSTCCIPQLVKIKERITRVTGAVVSATLPSHMRLPDFRAAQIAQGIPPYGSGIGTRYAFECYALSIFSRMPCVRLDPPQSPTPAPEFHGLPPPEALGGNAAHFRLDHDDCDAECGQWDDDYDYDSEHAVQYVEEWNPWLWGYTSSEDYWNGLDGYYDSDSDSHPDDDLGDLDDYGPPDGVHWDSDVSDVS